MTKRNQDEPITTETYETEETMTELVVSSWGDVRSLVQWKPKSIELMAGLVLPPDVTESTFVALRALTDTYTRARAVSIDDYLNTPLELCGVVMVMGTVKNNDREPVPVVMGEDGEVEMPTPYRSQYRQIFKCCGVNGEPCKPFFIKFMATSVEREVEETFLPRYGPGDWNVTVKVKITQVNTGMGRVYNFTYLNQ